MASIYLNYQADNACPFHRLLQPARFCSPDFTPMGHQIHCGDGLPSEYEWAGMHGIPNLWTIQEVAKIKRRGVKFLWSLDDAWEQIPDWNPAKPTEDGLAHYTIIQDMADLILVSTEGVKRSMARVADKVVVAPNMLDLNLFPKPPAWELNAEGKPAHSFTVNLPIRIVWAGGLTHKGDVEAIETVVDAILKKHGPKTVQFIFIGQAPPASIVKNWLHRGAQYYPPVPFAKYQELVNSSKPDIYLAPLADIPFNESKSNLRVIEGWALMACPIASPVGEYKCVRPGEDGRLADKPEEWISAINRLVSDHSYRLELAAAGRQRVEMEFDWNRWECRRPWHEVFARIFGCDLPTRENRDGHVVQAD